ncbi:MAG: PAS domain-containing protein, partial [Sphingomonas sp.]|nr:PAS domain-containing protein [Sphingomonas sp.]
MDIKTSAAARPTLDAPQPPAFLAGGGACGALIAARDWSTSPIGPIDTWPQSLKHAVAMMLRSPAPMVILWGPSGIMLYNQGYAAIAGGRHPDLLGAPVREGWPEVADFNDHVMRVVLSGETLSYRDTPLTLYRDGRAETLWFDLDYSPIPGADDRPEAVLCILADTTERHRAQVARAESEAKFLAMVNSIDQMIWSTLPDGFHDYFNDRWYEYTGVPYGSTDGEGWNGVFHPDDQARAWAVWRDCLATGAPYHIEYRLRHRSGQYRWVIGRAQPMRDADGRIIRWYGTCTDVDDLKRAEAALQQKTASLETLNRTGAALAAELDVDRIVQAVVDAGTALTGAAYGSFFYRAADGPYMLYALSGADPQAFANFPMPRPTGLFEPTFSGKAVVRCDDVARHPAYGSNAPYRGMPPGHLTVRSYLSVPVVSRAGEVIGAMLFGHPEPERFSAHDETLLLGLAGQAAVAIDNARLFAQVQHANETLESRVIEEVAQRTRAEEALRQAQKMEAVGQLTGGIAHDFNNLLTVIVGNVDLALRALDGVGGEPRVRRLLDGARKGADRAATLTQRLLAFSRRQPLEPKPIDVDKLVLGMSDLLNRALGETVRLEIVTSPGLWRVEVDPNQLESAILNLAVNARDAMPEGGRLVIETANAWLDEAYVASHAEVAAGHYVVLAVTDTGTGMPRELIEKVFEPFFTTKEVGKGTGLGLSMIYGFVKQSGGHVKIYSEPGHGTTVKIYLPRLLGDHVVAEDAASGGWETSLHAETILVAEDDDDVRAYTAECLRDLGYRVLEAHDGPAALRLLERQGQVVDLLFTDVVMPGMSGRDLADSARAVQPGLKLLYTSGYTRNAIVHAGRLDPGVEMIAKPF